MEVSTFFIGNWKKIPQICIYFDWFRVFMTVFLKIPLKNFFPGVILQLNYICENFQKVH